MEVAIIITVNLKGQISGPLSHKDHQIVHGTYSQERNGVMKEIHYSAKILHTDRPVSKCTRQLKVSVDAVNDWVKDCPEWEDPKRWKTFTKNQRILSHVKRFDEGFGVTFEKI